MAEADDIGKPFRPQAVNEVKIDSDGLQQALDTLTDGINPGESRYTQVRAAGAGESAILKFDDPDFMLAVTIKGVPDGEPVRDEHLAECKISLISRLSPRQNMAILIGAAQRIQEIERHKASKN